jgi:hypothetical protein
MDAAISRNGVTIRLTEERWFHIVETHDEMAGRHLQGNQQEGRVCYHCFSTNKVRIEKEVVLWQKKS